MSLHGPRHSIRAARAILNEFGFQSPGDIDLEMVAHDRRALIKRTQMDMAEGHLMYRDGRGTISVASNNSPESKQRFTIAHEIGHIELHRDDEGVVVCDEKDLNSRGDDRPRETEANRFAGELLMPQEMFRGVCDGEVPRIEVLKHLATTFQTSLTTSAVRYTRVGPETSAVVLIEEGKIKWFWPASDFPHRYLEEIKVPPPRKSGAAEALRKENGLEEPNPVTARTWFGDRAPQDQYFYESTHYSERYNQVISVLWPLDLDLGENSSL